METTTFLTVLTVALACLLKTAIACNGYDFKINSFKNCNPNSVLQFKDVTAIMDKDCNVIPSGCVNVVKTIKSSKGHYKIRKPPMPTMEGDVDICEVIEDDSFPEVPAFLAAYGVENKCPLSGPRKVCANGKKISLAKYKNQMGLLTGNSEVRLDLTHDGGAKTCLEISITVRRK